MSTTVEFDDNRAKRNVMVLVLVQAIMGAQMPMLFVIGGLAGNQIAGNPCFATLPISLIVFGSMTTAPWLSNVMQRYGRKIGFFIGAIAGALGAGISAYGVFSDSFTFLLIGSYFSGIYMSAQGFYRFAAADMASPAFRPKAISYVMAGGLMSAIVGPQLNILVSGQAVTPFLASYVAIAGLNLVGMFLFFLLDLPVVQKSKLKSAINTIRSHGQLLRDPKIVVAIICAMVSYALMNLVMTSTPLAVVGCGFTTSDANNVVMFHVLAMFVPSFFTGHLIVRFGVEKIMGLGLAILACAGIAGLSGVELPNFYVALILLGLGWNFGFIGGTTLLTNSHAPEERGRVQGMNDAIVFGCVTIASLASGGLMNCSGGDVVDGWNAVNYAMVPFLALAFGSLIWLIRQNKAA